MNIEIGKNTNIEISADERSIVLAGGCFWGSAEYMRRMPGVIRQFACYVNGKGVDVDYPTVCSGRTDHAEAVYVVYDPEVIDLQHLLHYFFKTFDPTQQDRQGNDVGRQYRSGIYYLDEKDRLVIEEAMTQLQMEYSLPVQTECAPLQNITRAEDFHQEYLVKNPGGYCHVSFASLPDEGVVLREPKKADDAWQQPSDEELQATLPEISYLVTQRAYTERPFSSPLDKHDEKGIYVDIVSGEALFSSRDKFDAGCGWPAFAHSIPELKESVDYHMGYARTEVRSKKADSHLGHVFNDGPASMGGLRYCINGAALRFVPLEKMEEEGYGEFIRFVE